MKSSLVGLKCKNKTHIESWPPNYCLLKAVANGIWLGLERKFLLVNQFQLKILAKEPINKKSYFCTSCKPTQNYKPHACQWNRRISLWLPISYFTASWASIIFRTALRSIRSNSGSFFENFVITSFQSSKKELMSSPTRQPFGSSARFEESKAWSMNSNSTDSTSEEKEEYRRTRFFKVLVIFFLEPVQRSTSANTYN